MNYEMEELVPVVGKLAEKYTAYESTSVTYEKAEQLMGAVLYCIHEAEGNKTDWLSVQEKIPAQPMYEIGAKLVREKAKEALRLYNGMLPDFESYGNRCLYETFIVGMPEFFSRYDPSFEPQNSILFLDYPFLKDISGLMGIDKIYEFLMCIRLEQEFLHIFPPKIVEEILVRNNRGYRELIENLCEIVLLEMIAYLLAGKPIEQQNLNEADYKQIRKRLSEMEIREMEGQVRGRLKVFVQKYGNGREELLDYVMGGVRGNLLRLKYGKDIQRDLDGL